MATVSALSSDIHPAPIGGPEVRGNDGGPTPARIAAALGSIPDDVVADPASAQSVATTPESAVLIADPWALVNVAWLVPLAGKLLQLPYEQVAKHTGDDCFIITDDQLRIINPALENVLKWGVWKLGAANTISHPLVGFGVALASLTAVKYGIYQFNESQKREGGPPRNPHPQQQQRSQQPINTDTSMMNGKTAAPEGAYSSQGSPAAAKAGSSQKDFVVVGE